MSLNEIWDTFLHFLHFQGLIWHSFSAALFLLACSVHPLLPFFLVLPSVAANLSPFSLSGSLTEKLIEGLKSPEPSLLLPDLLILADPFSSSAGSSTNGTSSVFALCPILNVPFICMCLPCPPLPLSYTWSQSCGGGGSLGKGMKKTLKDPSVVFLEAICYLLCLLSACCLLVAKAEVCVDSLIPGLEAPQAQRHSGQPELIPASMSGQHPGPQSREPLCNFWLQIHPETVISIWGNNPSVTSQMRWLLRDF